MMDDRYKKIINLFPEVEARPGTTLMVVDTPAHGVCLMRIGEAGICPVTEEVKLDMSLEDFAAYMWREWFFVWYADKEVPVELENKWESLSEKEKAFLETKRTSIEIACQEILGHVVELDTYLK